MLDPGTQVNVDRRKIEETKPSPVSMMPEGLLNTLNARRSSTSSPTSSRGGTATRRSIRQARRPARAGRASGRRPGRRGASIGTLREPRDDRGDPRDRLVDLGLGRERAEAEPDGRAEAVVGDAHRDQGGRGRRSRRWRRPSRARRRRPRGRGRIRRASPSRPGKPRLSVCGRRDASADRAVADDPIGRRARRSGPIRAGRGAIASGDPGVGLGLPALQRRGQADDQGHRRRPRPLPALLAAAEEGGGSVTPRRTSSTPTPAGPWNLWALAASVATPSPWKSTGMRPTACTASVWTGTSATAGRPRRPAGSRRSRCWRASGRRAACRGGSRRGRRRGRPGPRRRPRGAVTPQPTSSSRATGPATAGCSIGLTTTWPGSDPGEAEDGEVVRLGPARGEDDLVGMGPEDRARRSRAPGRAPAARRGRGRGGSRGCRRRARTAASPRARAGRAGSSRSGRGRSGMGVEPYGLPPP